MNNRPPAARQPAGSRQPTGSRKPAGGGRSQARPKRTTAAASARTTRGGGARQRPAKVAEKRAARSRRRILKRTLVGLAGLVVLGGIGAAVWAVGWSDLLALDEVRVSGADGSVEGDVVAVADPPMGMPLVQIDTDNMADAVRELPEVAEASVSRSWPRAITISVELRTPAAVIADGSAWWQVDGDGVLFGRGQEQPDGLPVLDAPSGDSAADEAARAAGVAVFTGLSDELADLVVEVAAPSEASVELTLDGGATVRWGTADQIDRKTEVLLSLLPEEASHYDVSAPSHPAVRP